MMNTNLTNGQEMVWVFDTWQEMLVNREIADCKRYRDAFFEYYGEYVKSEQAPLYLMFCAFVGAMDLHDWVDRKEKE